MKKLKEYDLSGIFRAGIPEESRVHQTRVCRDQ